MNKAAIGIAAGDSTEKIFDELLAEIDDETLDQLDITRELEPSEGLAGEPVTIGVLITGGAVVVSAVLRIIERRMEYNRQMAQMKIVAENFQLNPELGKILAEIAKKYADVSISQGLAKEAWGKTSSST